MYLFVYMFGYDVPKPNESVYFWEGIEFSFGFKSCTFNK